MRRRLTLIRATAIAGAVVIVTGMTTIAFAGSRTAAPGTVHVIEHATTDTVVDIGDPGDSTGDLLTFHNEVYDQMDRRLAGHDQGDCVRIDPVGGTWECRWITMLRGGSLTVEGPFLDTANTTLAVTGGTGAYEGARGQMELLSRNGGTEYDFIFHLTA